MRSNQIDHLPMHCTCRENEKEEYLEEFDQVSFDVHKFYLPMPTLKDSNGASLSFSHIYSLTINSYLNY